MKTSLRARPACVSTLLLCAVFAAFGCANGEKTEVEVEVRSVGFDSASRAPVVVLQDQDRKVALPIWIGPAEAQAIAMRMQGISPPRPMTHDLIKAILDGAGVKFEKVVIGELRNSTYYARIHLHSGRHELQIDSRPSDAIALAVRFARPIFVATALLKGSTSIDLQRVNPVATTVRVSGVTLQNLTDDVAEYFSLPPGKGVIVADVEAGSPEGLQRGDVILEIDGVAVTGVGDFESKMRGINRGSARLSVQRGSERLRVQFGPNSG